MGKKKDKDVESGGGGVGGTYYYSMAPPPPVYQLPNKEAYMSWLVPVIFVMDVVLFGISMYENNCPLTNDDPRHGCVFEEYLGRFSFLPVSKNPLLGPSTTTDWEDFKWNWCKMVNGGVLYLVYGFMPEQFIYCSTWSAFSLLESALKKNLDFIAGRIGPLYVLSGFGGSLMSCVNLLRKKKLNVISVGASGALFGLLGAMLSELITNWTIYANKCASFTSLVAVTSFNLALGFIPGVDNSAHIGGFLSGFLLGFILLIQPQYGYVNRKYLPPGYGGGANRKSRHKCCQYLLFILALITLTTGYAYGVMRIFRFNTGTHIHSNLTVQ